VADPQVLFGLEYPAAQYESNGNIRQANRYWRATAGANQGTLAFTYSYDNLNRLASANFTLTPPGGGASSASYTWSMDEFGNVTAQTKTSGPPGLPGTLGLAVDRDTNRLTGKLHDVAGILLESTATGANQKLAYLDQGHIREVKDGADALLYRYYYDADGKRRIKATAVTPVFSSIRTTDVIFATVSPRGAAIGCSRTMDDGPWSKDYG
jgi:hypothetical protein